MFAELVPKTMRPLRRFEREMENLVEKFFAPEEDWWRVTNGFELEPKVNVAETENAFEVTVELPGMKAEEFNVELKGNNLWITGERKEEKEEKGKTFHRVERRYGEFKRVIPMSTEVSPEKVSAEYKEGLLKVMVPKTEVVKPKKIAVKT